MIQFNLSKNLAKPLARHLKPAKVIQPDLVWRADVALIGAYVCIVMQEQHSQYIMVLCGLNQEDFANFPQLFRERFWREAAALCRQANLYDNATLHSCLNALCEQQYYQLDPEPLEEGKITKVMEKLERLFLHERHPLPTDGKSAFSFGFQINTRLPKAAQLAGQANAAEVMGNICLNLIEAELARQAKANNPVLSVADNIVTVNFGQRGKPA